MNKITLFYEKKTNIRIGKIQDSNMIIYIFQVVDGFKNNEEQLKKYVEEYKLKLSKSVIYFTIHFTNYN